MSEGCDVIMSEGLRFSRLPGDTMGMRGAVVKFGDSLAILVMRSVVMASGHI
jgi:hypothetical protein